MYRRGALLPVCIDDYVGGDNPARANGRLRRHDGFGGAGFGIEPEATSRPAPPVRRLIAPPSSPSSSVRESDPLSCRKLPRHLITAVPYKIHTVLTDNGTHFTSPGNVCSAASDIKVALDAREAVWA